jgi:hypothetical protein
VAESSKILASLDQFIENFRTEDEIAIGHTVATAEQRLATGNPAEIQDIGHFGHFGHSDQDTHANASPYQFRRLRETDAMVSRKLLDSSGYNGQSGQSQENRGFDRGQSGNGIGHSGHSSTKIGSNDLAIPRYTDPSGSGFDYWRDIYQERAAIREHDGGYSRLEAELLAWRELECRWHMAHGEPAAAGVCAGCQQPIGTENVILLIDGNRCHDRAGHACLIRYGDRWRNAATAALIALGLQPPASAV